MYKVKVATVFSGIGAVEQALNKLDITTELIFACDNDKFAKQAYLANYKPDKWYDDIHDIKGTDYKDKVELLIGGSPCQSFSIAGLGKGLDDFRGTLIYSFIKLIRDIQPKCFVFENVAGLLTNKKGATWEIVKKEFESLGYNLYTQILNAKDYGIPQSRRRLFIVGSKDDYEFEFPEPVELKLKVKDLLEPTFDAKYLLSDKMMAFVLTTTSQTDAVYQLRRTYLRENKSNVCPTLTANMGTGGHNVPLVKAGNRVFGALRTAPTVDTDIAKTLLASNGGNRASLDNYVSVKNILCTLPTVDTDVSKTLLASGFKVNRASLDNFISVGDRLRKLTPRECLRLMGFDDSFKIVCSDSQTYKQAGNSMVVDVMEAILKNILKVGGI